MKVGDLVKIDFEYGTVVGIFMSEKANYAKVYITRTPDGEFVGQQRRFAISRMKVISDSR